MRYNTIASFPATKQLAGVAGYRKSCWLGL